MSLAHAAGQFFKNNLNDQVKQLTCLQYGTSFSIHVQEYQLQSIYHLLLYAYNNFPNKLNLNSMDLLKLTQICAKLFELHRSARPGNTDIWRRCELWALKILILVVKQPSIERMNQKILEALPSSLVKLICVPEEEADPYAAYHTSLLTCLAACCLSQIDLDRIMSPDEAHQLITDKLLPMAVHYLNKEPRYEGPFLDVLVDDYHGVKGCQDAVFTNKCLFTYPQLVQLLMRVMRRSDSGPRGYRKRFEIMLNLACSRDNTSDEDIVALNVLVAHYLSAGDDPFEHLGRISLDLLTKNSGFHRIHIAFILYRCFVIHKNHVSEMKDLFMTLMVDDLIATNDDLMLAVVLNTIRTMKDDVSEWNRILDGKQMAIIDKLIERNCQPHIYNMFLRQFRKDDLKNSKFDSHTMKPISQFIDNIYSLVQSKRNDLLVIGRLKENMICIKNFLKLRYRRLGQDLELRLNQVIELLVKDEHLRRSLPADGGELISRANTHQVYPHAWVSTLELLRYVETKPYVPGFINFLKDPGGIDVQICRDFIQLALPHLLMVDTEKFYRELGTLELIELIYKYCKQVNDSVMTPIKEILLTWPQDHCRTRLDSKAHRRMLHKFIELLINEFDSAKKNTTPPREHPDAREEARMNELLFGLMAAYSCHREALRDVLHSLEREHKLTDRNSWLKDNISRWTKLMIDYVKKKPSNDYRYWGPVLMQDWQIPLCMDSLASVHIAFIRFTAIKGDPQGCSELKESTGLIVQAIRKALTRGLAQATVDSFECKQYRKMSYSLPAE